MSLGMIKLHSTASSATVLRADLVVERTDWPGDTTLGYVLCELPPGHAQPYVTWSVRIDEEGAAFHASAGNYFDRYEDARTDYDRRRGAARTLTTKEL